MSKPNPEIVESAAAPNDAVGTKADLASAKRVLGIEAAAITNLAESLGEPFLRALDIMAAVQGRVVVTGMGKSGHICNKIVATLSSTGTPALFVHPAEASHGDLGMITKADAVLALSNSGETTELADMVAYTKRFTIPLVAVTGAADSTLALAADVSLVLPKSEEACPMGLAPTTSTSVMMALGDAISVALLERKGFSSDEFHVLHPGGKLGKLLLKVSDIMHTGKDMPLAAPDDTMAGALVVMTQKSLGVIGVVDGGGRLQGIVTDGDLRRHMSDDLMAKRTKDVMTANPKTIRSAALASEAVQVMNEMQITNLFVVDDGRVAGVLHIHDCMRAGVV